MTHCHGCALCYNAARRDAIVLLSMFCACNGGPLRTLAHWTLYRIGRGEAVGMG